VRKLRHLLKEATDAEQHADTVATLCCELQTNDVRAQALDLLASSRKVSANTLLEVVEGFLHWFETQGNFLFFLNQLNITMGPGVIRDGE
jgi:1-aminocyclopropane-1-carboxylate deaminase/D-cysteine desulfhydrase-like pyridoxal-dependent ACC family enzyme